MTITIRNKKKNKVKTKVTTEVITIKKQIQESVQNEKNNTFEKIKYPLSTFNPQTTFSFMADKQLYQKVEELYICRFPSSGIDEKTLTKCSLYELLSAKEVLIIHLLPRLRKEEEQRIAENLKNEAESKAKAEKLEAAALPKEEKKRMAENLKKEAESKVAKVIIAEPAIVALILRIMRFRLKLLTILNLTQYVSNHPDSDEASVRLKALIKELKSNIIQLDFTNPIMYGFLEITAKSTLFLIIKYLTNAESLLKDSLFSLVSIYKADPFCNPFDSADIRTAFAVEYDKRQQALTEPDYYYIWQMLRTGTIPVSFNEFQKKQWESYTKELQIVFSFYLLKGIRFAYPFQTRYFISEISTINMSYYKLSQSSKPISNNTFSRLINALNLFMMNAWLQLSDQAGFYATKESPHPDDYNH